MPRIEIEVECPVHDSFRVRQTAGMFDLPIDESAVERFSAEVPDPSEAWRIGAIVGPSGSGKSTLAARVFGPLPEIEPWPTDRAVIDCFGNLPIKRIIRTLTAVGFSSPPSWIKPWNVLSNGEKFRCELARALLGADGDRPVVFDEFTSPVDRTVARISSWAVSRAIRAGTIPARFVAVTCHRDILRWLRPDWIVEMPQGTLTRRRLRRPRIRLRIERADRSVWRVFRRHHYLNHDLHTAAACWLGLVDDRPAAFTAVLYFPHPIRSGWREHRTVCLPDFQGVGIGTAMSEFVAGLYAATGRPYFSTTGHPAMIHHRIASPLWKLTRKPGMVGPPGRTCGPRTLRMARSNSSNRNTAGFEYIGPKRIREARLLGLAIPRGTSRIPG